MYGYADDYVNGRKSLPTYVTVPSNVDAMSRESFVTAIKSR